MDLTPLENALQSRFPIDAERVSFHCIPDEDERAIRLGPKGSLRMTFRLIRWDNLDGQRLVRDIIEQELAVIYDIHLDQPIDRLAAYLEGWAIALTQVAQTPADADVLWPSDMCKPRVLDLVRPATADDFAAALGRRSRLGRFIATEDSPS